ncbi:MAG TPA: holin, BlyA family protein [Clostridiales bacterium]|nr:holin, BlyA family protein [Clostridiales bacterium]
MLKKIGQGLALAELKIKNSIYRFFHEEKGGTEIVAILLIIIILIAIVVIFKDKLSALLDELFSRISNDVKTDL